MIYAETDFFLAITKESDWLKERAKKLEEKHRGNIETSVITLLEVLLIGNRFELNPERIVASIFGIANVKGASLKQGMQAAHLISTEGFNVFDAFHAALSDDLPILSSDKKYDETGRERIKLEPN